MAAPSAVARDPFYEQTCIDATNCVGPGSCVTGVACVPRSCQPLLFCSAETSSTSQCQVNTTIDGQTCQVVVGVGARTTREDNAHARVVLSDGNVSTFNLPNSWITPSVEAGGHAAGVSTGEFVVGVYKSHIVDEGPRGGPLGILSPSPDHDWDHVMLVVHHGSGATTGETVIVGVYLLDLVPEGCYARTSAAPVLACPRVSTILP